MQPCISEFCALNMFAKAFPFLHLVFAEELSFKCVSDCSNGIGVSAASRQVVVVEDVQRQQPMANSVLCYKTL